MENSKGAANGMSVEEAMKVLNMKKFDAEELNDKFRFRVQSVAQGIGGSLTAQKDIYTAWEYLNRMLARESSTHTEDLLRKADKTMKKYEKPKRLDMIPFKLSNPARKASLIIEKDDKKRKPEKEVKSILKVKEPEKVGGKLPPIRTLMALEAAKNINAPGGGSVKRVRWKDDEILKTAVLDKTKKTNLSNKQIKKKLISRSMPSRRPLLAKHENTMLQLKGVTGISKMERVDDGFKHETKVESETLGKLLDELPKLLKLPAIPFKRVPGLNEMFTHPKRPSKHDQRSAARRMLWMEESDHILKGVVPNKAKRKHSDQGAGKTRASSGKLMRKSLRKQEEVLYRRFHRESSSEISSATDLPNFGSPHEQILLNPHSGSPHEQRLLNLNKEITLASKGLYTPSRIENWIESSKPQNTE